MSEDSGDMKNGKEASPARSVASSSSNRDKRTSRSRSGSRRRSASRSPGSTRRRHQGDREVPTPSRCLGVFGLSLHTQTRHLREVFSKYGQIEEITIVSDAQTGRSRGFAFVYFDSIEEAENAKEACNGIEIDCRKIRVDFSITKRPHTPTPGIYMGRPTHRPRPRRGGYGYDDRYEDRYDDRYDDRYEDRYDRRYDRRSYRSPPNYRRYRRSRSHSPYGGGYGNR